MKGVQPVIGKNSHNDPLGAPPPRNILPRLPPLPAKFIGHRQQPLPSKRRNRLHKKTRPPEPSDLSPRQGATQNFRSTHMMNRTQRNTRLLKRALNQTVISFILLTSLPGCTSPDGTPNNTATGALAGGLFGGVVGALAGGPRHSGRNALFGAAAGALTGAVVGHMIDQEQRERLREQSPQTWATIQHNDYVMQQQSQPPSGQPAPPPPAVSAPPQTPVPSPTPGGPPASAPGTQGQTAGQNVVPLTVEDIKALAAAGVKPDVIIKEIENSNAVFGPQDIAAAQQTSPPMDASILDFMKSHSRPS